MTDYSGLKRLAEAATAYAEEDWHTPERLFIAMEKPDAEFVSGCSPFSVLALIAKMERTEEELDKTELRALKFIHQCNAHADLYRELRAERDKLKAENEALRGLIGECAQYLGSNDLNSICHGSILHRAMDAAMSKAEHP